jgi:hypothetical protein
MRKTNLPYRRITSVWLRKNKGMDFEIYYCSTCRAPQLQHKGDVVMEVPGDAPIKFPVLIKCRNRECKRVYQFEAIVEEV